ncbi:MAG TPA: hypothetical protein VGS06_42205 [Streptosporangiaceae bacterium]|nr:hypothetical protein [Streptosporangiaceae bacterium]
MIQSLLVASQRVIHDGVKSAWPFGPNGPDADRRAKTTAEPPGDQEGPTETTPAGCETGVQRPAGAHSVICLPPDQITRSPPSTAARVRPAGEDASHDPCTSVACRSVRGERLPNAMASRGRPSAAIEADPSGSSQYSRPWPSGHQPASSSTFPVVVAATADDPAVGLSTSSRLCHWLPAKVPTPMARRVPSGDQAGPVRVWLAARIRHWPAGVAVAARYERASGACGR